MPAKVPEKARDFEFQTRQVFLDDVPDEQEIHAPIAVNKAISESDDPLPGSAGGIAYRRRQAVRGLADDFEIADDCVLDHPLPQKGLASVSDIGLDGGDGIVDVTEIGKVALHKGCASASI